MSSFESALRTFLETTSLHLDRRAHRQLVDNRLVHERGRHQIFEVSDGGHDARSVPEIQISVGDCLQQVAALRQRLLLLFISHHSA